MCSRLSKLLALQMAAQQRWKVELADAHAAFLQGNNSETARKVYCFAVPELAIALGVSQHRMVQVHKACYGLANAPKEWWASVSDRFEKIGLKRLRTDQCVWIGSTPSGETCTVITVHVDDFLIVGSETCQHHQQFREEIRKSFRWSPWKEREFTMTGIDVCQLADFSIVISQARYLEDIEEIHIRRHREKDAVAEAAEVSALRAVLGGLQWKSTQTGPQIAAGLSLLQSEIAKATVDTLHRANKLLREAKLQGQQGIRIHHFPGVTIRDLLMVGWTDGVLGNRPNGSSTGGYVCGVSTPDLKAGRLAQVSLVAWSSQKLDRVCRSSLAAEVQSCGNAEDLLWFCRLSWAEMLGMPTNRACYQESLRSVEALLIVDAKSMFDAMENESSGVGMREKRTGYEMQMIKESAKKSALDLRWVNSDAQLADALTKAAAVEKLQRFFAMGSCWKITYDPSMLSAKRRKALGLHDPLEDIEVPDSDDEAPVEKNLRERFEDTLDDRTSA